MENASKALIIAGAILLAILIIGLGIFIYRQAANTVSDTGMDQLAIQQFNAQFTQYDSKTVSGGSAKALYDTVVNNNNTDTEKRFVSLNLVAKTADGTKNIVLADTDASKVDGSKSDIKTSAKYKVEIEQDTKTGLTNKIKITEE
jgi:glutathione peroxidase-family protein